MNDVKTRSQVGQKRRRTARRSRPPIPRLTLDEAFIAVLIGAMEANQHVSSEEAARAHNIIWSMKRFRRKSGDRVGSLIDAMRTLIQDQGAGPVIKAAARMIPARLRLAAFALSADLILADGKIEATERRFLDQFGMDLGLERAARDGMLDAMRIKNSA